MEDNLGEGGTLSKIYDILSGKEGIIIILIAIIILSISVFYNFMTYSTAAINLCDQCHSMQTFTNGLRLTPHSGFNCYRCHDLTIEGVTNEIISYFISNPSSTEIADKYSPRINMYRQCLSCHVLTEIGEKRIHETHIQVVTKLDSCDICHNPHSPHDIDVACIQCHKLGDTIDKHSTFHTLAISELEKGNDQVCLKCHSKKATWKVEICPESILGLLRGYQCFDCHEPPLKNPDINGRKCTDCHAM